MSQGQQGPAPEAATPSSDAASAGSDVSRPTIADAIADLVQLFVDYVRQETESVVKEKVVLPTQKAGQVVAFALAAAGALFLGIAYLSVAAMMLLASFVGWPGALAIIGAVLVVGAASLTYMKMRSIQS